MKWYFTFRKSYGWGITFDIIYFSPYKTNRIKTGHELYLNFILLKWGFECGFEGKTVDINE